MCDYFYDLEGVQELYKTKIVWPEYRAQSGSKEIWRIQVRPVGNYLQTE